MRVPRSLALAGLAILSCVASPASASCDCVGVGPVFQPYAYEAADLTLALMSVHDEVFLGRVLERVPYEPDQLFRGSGADRYVLSVERQWKGSAEGRVTVLNGKFGNCSSAAAFDHGEQFLVFATWSEADDALSIECGALPPILLGFVGADLATGYAERGRVLGLKGDLFERLDAAALRLDHLSTGSDLEDGPPTTLTVLVLDALSAAPVEVDALEVRVQVGGRAALALEPISGTDLPLFRTVVPPGWYRVFAAQGDTRGEVSVIATGGDRVVTVQVRQPPAE